MSDPRQERWRKRQAKMEAEVSGRAPYFKFQAGLNRLRIIPHPNPAADFWVENQVSFGVGPAGKSIVTRPGPGSDVPDVLGSHIDKLLQSDDDANKARASEMRGKTRANIFVLDRNEEEKGEQLLQTNLNEVLRQILGIAADAEYANFDHAQTGVDLKINYTPATKKSFPKWHIVPSRDASELGHPEILEKGNLFELYKMQIGPSDPDYVQAAIDGKLDEFFAAKKKDREERAPATPTGATKEEESTETPGDDEDEVVRKEAERIRKDQDKKKKGKPAPPPPSSGTDAKLLAAQWHFLNDENEAEGPVSGKGIEKLLVDRPELMVIDEAQEIIDTWTEAAALGFRVGSKVGQDLADAFK